MNTFRNVRFYSVIFVLLSIGILIASRSSGRTQPPQATDQEGGIKPIATIEGLRIVNHTSAFNIAGIKKIADRLFEITYKNEYNKSVTGFEVSIGSMRVQTELILGGDDREFVAPGSTFQKAYAAQEGLDRDGIHILAVVFDDGSSDGDTKYIKEIIDYRFGIKTERQRVVPLLQQVITSKSDGISMALAQLETDVSSSVQPTQQNTRLDNVGLGIRNERRRVLDEIRILKDKHQRVQSDEGESRQLKEDLVIVKTISENIIRLSSISIVLHTSSQ